MASDESWILEQAKEELQILETQHPERFEYLKLQIKSFISEISFSTLPENLVFSSADDALSTSASAPTSTQVSSNRKRRGSQNREMGKGHLKPKQKFRRRSEVESSKDRVDVAIEKAEACLRKIREIKKSFLNVHHHLL